MSNITHLQRDERDPAAERQGNLPMVRQNLR